jgi:anti-sigma B factor antagonist
VIELRGELDVHCAPLVDAAVERALAVPGRVLVVDLSDVDFIDSAGLHALVRALRRTHELRRELRIVCPPGHLRRIFTLTGLSGHFALCPTRSEALAVAGPES